MDNHELLQEKYDDALFALLMNERADSEGSRLIRENEALLQDPSSEVPKESERRFLRTIDRETFRNAHKRTNKKVLRFIGRLALGALIAVLLFGTAFALSPAFRAATLNLLMKIDEKTASWEFVTNTDTEIETAPLSLTINWLPVGYKKDTPVLYDDQNVEITCRNDIGDTIRITAHANEKTVHTIDIEGAQYSEIYINGFPGALIIKDDLIRIAWVDQAKNTAIIIQSTTIDADTILRIAESIAVA